ncbi:MAG: P-loop NTPase fold protein [Mycoplasmoidaceae bacterium]
MSYVSECTHDILINDDDEDLLKASKIFLKNLEKDYKVFLDNYENELKKWNSFISKKSKNVFFKPEFFYKKSPITIIDSKWGNGKTFFVEHLGKNIKLSKVNTEFINFIIIDLWNFIDSDDMIDEIFKHIIFNLGSNSKKCSMLAQEIVNNGLKYIIEPLVNNTLNTNIKMHKKNVNAKAKKTKFKKSIIVFDNLERMGKRSWEIMKLIQKLSNIDNLIFILTMDIDKINDGSDEFEKGIEKFIDLPSYNLKQDYVSLLNNLGFNKEISMEIDKLLKIHIGKKHFSIRELKKIMLNESFFKKYMNISKLRVIFILKNKIWKISNKDLFQFCKNNFVKYTSFLIEMYFYQNKMKDSFNEIFSKYNINHDQINEVNAFFLFLKSIFSRSSKNLQKDYEIIFDDDVKEFIKNNLYQNHEELKLYDKDHSKNIIKKNNEELNSLSCLFAEIKVELKNKINSLTQLIKDNENIISDKEKRIEKHNKKIKKQHDSNDTKHDIVLISEKTIERETNEINELKNSNSSIRSNIIICDDLLKDIKDAIYDFESLNKIFNKYSSDIKKLYKKNSSEFYEFEKINLFFFNLYDKYELPLNFNDENSLKQEILIYFKENFDEFVEFFENELSKEELLNK